MNNTYIILSIAVIAAVTLILRALPFLIFRSGNIPNFVTYLGNTLPYAIMGMLVIYCLRGTNFLSSTHGIPEIAAALSVVVLHVWKRKTLLSICGGTAVYMLLVQLVF